jgi:NAD+-dependent secondary alcohol dehydrogenase Adh1
MKAVRLHEYHKFPVVDEVPEPTVQGPLDVVVKIGGAGVCRTDLHIMEGQWDAAMHPTLPYTIGHENAGWVHEIGSAVTNVAVGDTVILHPQPSCGLCRACRAGNDMHCVNAFFPGLSDNDGGMAEYMLTSARACVKLDPETQPKDVAALADAGITAYHAVKRVADLAVPGATVVSLGVGGVGHVGLQLVRELGSGATVVAVDPNPQRRALAAGLGADAVLDSAEVADAVRDLTGGRGADLVIDFVGTDESHAAGIEMLVRGGTYSIVGFGGMVTVPSAAMVGGDIDIVSNLVGSWIDLWEVLQLHARGRLTLKTETHPLEKVNEVLGRLREGDITGRAVLVPGSSNGGKAA